MNKIFEVVKSKLKGNYWARKFCIHCEEDHDNICMRSWLSGVNYCSSSKVYGSCNGRKKSDERWVY